MYYAKDGNCYDRKETLRQYAARKARVQEEQGQMALAVLALVGMGTVYVAALIVGGIKKLVARKR